MPDVPRGTRDPIVLALVAIVREVHAKRIEERRDRHAKMAVVDGGKPGGAAA